MNTNSRRICGFFSSIRKRLIISFLMVMLILVTMLITSGYALFQLDYKYKIYEGSSRIAKLIQETQVAEKAYRKYYENQQRDKVKEKTNELLHYLNTNGKIFEQSQRTLIDQIIEYQEAFRDIVSLNIKQGKIRSQIHQNIESVQSQGLWLLHDIQEMESERSEADSAYLVTGFKTALWELRYIGLIILLNHSNSIFSKDEKRMNLLFEYVNNYSPGVFGALEFSSKDLYDGVYQQKVGSLISSIRLCITLIHESILLVNAETKKEDQFDQIADSLIYQSDIIMKNVYTDRERLKKSTAVLLTLLIMVGMSLIVLVTMAINHSITKPLNKILNTTRLIREGDLDQKIAIEGNNEFTELSLSINATTAHLAQSLRLLEREVLVRRSAEDEIKALSRNLITTQEKERAAIARELHDELGQMLTVLKIQLTRVFPKMPISPDCKKNSFKEIIDSVDTLMHEVKELALRLRPKILDRLELNEALHWICQEFSQKTAMTCSLTAEEINLKDKAVELTLFRTVQESLTNITKHSDATHVKVNLSKANEFMILRITDDGKGCNINAVESSKTLGITGIKERTRLIGGNIEIATAPQNGFSITLSVPISSIME